MQRMIGWVVLALSLVLSAAASGQVPSRRQPVARYEVQVPDARILDLWASYYYSHEWEKLQDDVREKLLPINNVKPESAAPECPVPGSHIFDFSNNTYRIVFVSQLQNPAGEVINFQISSVAREPYATRFPGVDEFYDVFLDYGGDGKLRTSYSSGEKVSPVVEALPGFVKQIGLAGLANFVDLEDRVLTFEASRANVDAIAKWSRSASKPKPGFIFVTIGRVDLPFDRGTVAISDEAVIPPGPTEFTAQEEKELVEDAAELRDDLLVHKAGGSACAARVAQCLYDAVAVEFGGPAMTLGEAAADCPSGKWTEYKEPPRDACGEFIKPVPEIAECYATIAKGERARCFASHRITDVHSSVARRDAKCMAGTGSDFEAAGAVENAFGDSVRGEVVKAKKDTTYDNLAQQHISLGLVAGLMLSRSGDPRVKMDSGTISSDPVTGTLSMAAVNFHPLGYDPKATKPSTGERFRLFAGATLTPEFGLGGGVGYGLVRGLSLNVGYAWLRVNAVKDGDGIGDTPSQPDDPFENGISRIFFVGFAYAF